MMNELMTLLLRTRDVGRLLGRGVRSTTVTRYLRESRPGGKYENHPFPAPDGVMAGRYFWLKSRAQEIVDWDEARLGSGARTDLQGEDK